MTAGEAILLKRFTSNGDAEAFARIVEQHAPLVYGVCLRILADKDKASDAVQNTFLQLVRNPSNISGSLSSWLHRVATCKAIDLVRSDSQRRQRESKYAADSEKRRPEQEIAAWQEVSVYLDQELDKLDDQVREILILRFFENKTTREIAKKCDISHPTVSRRIDTGIVSLRHKLKSRGLFVPAVMLTTMLTENMVKAAPAFVMKELGKIAIAGGKAAATATGSGILASIAVKAKIIATATVITLAIGSAAIYYNSTQQTEAYVDEKSNPNAATFQMIWHPGGVEKRENIPVAAGCFRVHDIDILESPPDQWKEPAESNTIYGQVGFSDYGRTKYTCGLKKSSDKIIDPDIFFIDINQNGRLEQAEVFNGTYATFPPLDKIHYGSFDITLRDENQSRTHRVFAWLGSYDDLYIVSQCYMQGQIRLGEEEIEAVLVDYDCDGSYSSGQINLDWIVGYGSRERNYDRIGWDADGSSVIETNEMNYIGGCTIYKDKAYRIDCSVDGKTVTVQEFDIPMGYLQMPADKAYAILIGDAGPMTINISDGVTALPAGTYWVDYARISEPNESGDLVSTSLSGRYIEEPWLINTGMTTKIEREVLVVTEEDKQRFEEQFRALTAIPEEPEVESLLGKPLGNVDEFNLALNSGIIKEKNVLLCFFDYEQRPSRNCILQLSNKAQELKAQGIEIFAVHASLFSQNTLDQWLEENNISFPVGMIESDIRNTRLDWGIDSLPWLILTDKQHIVTAEGFSVGDLEEKIEE